MNVDMDMCLMREAIKLSELSVKNGNQPFGALLATKNGKIILTAENRELTKNKLHHAEHDLVEQIYEAKIPQEKLREMSLYTSTQPCNMCAGAIEGTKVGRVVYGCSSDSMRKIIGWTEEKVKKCKEEGRITGEDILSKNPNITLIGPFLEDEAQVPHQAYWFQNKNDINNN